MLLWSSGRRFEDISYTKEQVHFLSVPQQHEERSLPVTLPALQQEKKKKTLTRETEEGVSYDDTTLTDSNSI